MLCKLQLLPAIHQESGKFLFRQKHTTDNNILQGTVAMHFKYGGIFTD